MRIYRCYADCDLNPGEVAPLDPEEAHHLAQVRRARAGDAVILTNGRGVAARGVLELEGKKGRVAIEEVVRRDPPPAEVLVACALTKSGAFEDILQRAVELGMTRFVPLVTERCVVEFDDRRAEKKVEKWERHAIEALKQCERTWLPVMESPVALREFVARPFAGRRFLLEERTESIERLDEVARGLTGPAALLIGPEGGWSEAEKHAMREAGIEPVSLGAQAVLRTETAWLAALALLGR